MISRINIDIKENRELLYNFYTRHYDAPRYLLPSNPDEISGIYYGYFEDDYILGVTKIDFSTPFLMHTSSTVVHTEYRNQGIASRINSYLENLAKSNGITKMTCNIYVDNLASIMVKLKRGYLIEGLLRNHDEQGKHEYVLSKEIS
jgi:ribosomal protein S18 acetylase RimI-like enzyme